MRRWRTGSVPYAWTSCTSLASILVDMFSASGDALLLLSHGPSALVEAAIVAKLDL